jgi:hypothetical protein
MLDHEYELLEERLRTKRGEKTRFFAFADTVATASQEDAINSKSHGWMGVRFQTRPGGPANDIILHVKLWDRFRLAQQDALGILGVNLLHMAFFPSDKPEERIAQLIDSLNTWRVEVNMIRFSGPDLQHLDNRLMSLELVRQKLTEAVLFSAQGEVLHAGDALFRHAVLIQRGSYRPVTNGNVEIVNKVFDQFKKQMNLSDAKVLFEITMNSLAAEGGRFDDEDFLHRVDTLAVLGHAVMVSNFQLFYQMKSFLRECTREPIGIVLGAALLPKMFDPAFYAALPGGILEGMSRLFDEKTRVFVYPNKSDKLCETAATFNPGGKMQHLYKYLTDNGSISDALGCNDVNTTVHSSDIMKMLEKRDPAWKKLVPEGARKLIEERQLFGYRP